jgi:hypothetical protein
MQLAIKNIQRIDVIPQDKHTAKLEIEFKIDDAQEPTVENYNGRLLIDVFSKFVKRNDVCIQALIKAFEKISYV